MYLKGEIYPKWFCYGMVAFQGLAYFHGKPKFEFLLDS